MSKKEVFTNVVKFHVCSLEMMGNWRMGHG